MLLHHRLWRDRERVSRVVEQRSVGSGQRAVARPQPRARAQKLVSPRNEDGGRGPLSPYLAARRAE
jgi:hypothetical protein